MIIESLRDQYKTRSAHFAPYELYDSGRFAPAEKKIYGPILDFVEELRKEMGRPLRINAGVRTQAKQRDLKRRGYKAATYSPHVYRCALDIDTTSKSQTRRLVSAIRRVSRRTGIPIRIGWKSYMRSGMTFVHIDCAPLIAAAALREGKIPRWVYNAWKNPGAEW